MDSDVRSTVGRRVVVSSIVVVVLVAAGSVVFIRQTSWWRCSHDTSLRTDSQLAYDLAPADLPPEAIDVIDQVSALPGVGEFLGGAPLANEVEVTSGAADDIVVSDGPYIEVLENHRDISFDPVAATVSWDRGQPGAMATPRVLGDDFVTFGDVEDDGYRLTSLNASDGSVRGCAQVGRDGGGGRMIDTAQSWSPDESAVALATPGRESTTLTRIDLDSRSGAWSTDVDEAEIEEVRWYGTVIAVGDTPSYSAPDETSLWKNFSTPSRRTSITALDAATGEVAWTWPEEIGDDDTPRFGVLVPTVDPTNALVTLIERVPGDDGDVYHVVALDPDNGTEVWSHESSSNDANVIGDHVLVDFGDQTGVLDAATGSLLWSERSVPGEPGRLTIRGPQTWGEQLLVRSGESGVTVLDPATGERQGSTQFEFSFPDDGTAEFYWDGDYWVTDDALTVTMDTGDEILLLVFGRN